MTAAAVLARDAHSRYVPDMAGATPAPRRRDEALAFILERIARGGVAPSGPQIARHLRVSDTRAKQLIAQLERDGAIERTPGAQRSIVIRDIAHNRELLLQVLERMGWAVSHVMGGLPSTFPNKQLPMLPPLEHLPDLQPGE